MNTGMHYVIFDFNNDNNHDPFIASPNNNVEMADQSILILVFLSDANYNVAGVDAMDSCLKVAQEP